MRIYYDEARKNIVLGATTRLFASSSLVAQTDRGRVSVIYRANNFRELYIKHNQVLREDGSPAGGTISAVIDYLNGEFNKSPFTGGEGSTTVLKIDGGAANTTFPDFLLRLDFGRNGATINPSGTP